MRSEKIHELACVHGPFVSVYLPPGGGPDRPALHSMLAAQDADPAVLDTVAAALSRGTPGSGRALIAVRDEVLVDGPPAWSPSVTVARVSDLPYVLPLMPKHAVRAPEASLVAAGRAREDTVSGPGARTVFDQFMFEIARPEGPVSQGIGPCTAALRARNVDALVVTEGALCDRSVWVDGRHREQVAEDAADLRAVGLPANRQRADEAVPMAALAVGADVLVADAELPLVDGVGVLRRHP